MACVWLYLYGALCWKCRSRRSTSLPLGALSSGVLSKPPFRLMPAPLSINSRTTSVLLLHAAKCNAVDLKCSVALFTSAPSCSRRLMTSVWLNSDARVRAVPYQHSHPQAFHLAISEQPFWCHPMPLHEGSF